MGVFSAFADGVGDFADRWGNRAGKVRDKVGDLVGRSGGIAENVAYTAGNANVEGAVFKTIKGAGILALIGGGAMALWAFTQGSRNKRSRETREELSNVSVAPQLPMMEPALEAGPAEGRAPNEWRTKVTQTPGARARALNPRMDVAPAEAVGDLRSPV